MDEVKLKNFIKSFLQKNNFLNQEENVINAEKAFRTNAILRFLFKEFENKQIKQEQLNEFFKLLIAFRDSKVDLVLEAGKITIKDPKKEENNENKPKQRTTRARGTRGKPNKSINGSE